MSDSYMNEDDEDSVYSRSSTPLNGNEQIDDHLMLTSIPRELQLLPRSSGSSPLSVYPRTDLKAFTRFGPYQAKIHKDPSPSAINWKVSELETCVKQTFASD